MKAPNRDLLVLVKDELMNESFMEQELEQLNNLLFHYETLDNFCSAHEIFDINRNRVIESRRDMQKIIRQKKLNPFQFILNKN